MEASKKELRVVLLGKTGSGKSTLANTIFGEKVFEFNHTANSETYKCQPETRSVNGRRITLIDTPGFFDTDRSEEDLKPDIVRCITECAPGPHAFLIVLKVERFTEHEQNVIKKINEYFSEEVFKYATIVFTHGDQLPEGWTIEQYFAENELVINLVKKCGGRCHVVDNKYWNGNPRDEYRSNQFQVEELLKTIDKMVMENNGSCYTNEMLQEVEGIIKQEVANIRRSSANMSEEEIREQAKISASRKVLIKVAGVGTGALLGALCGAAVMIGLVVTALKCAQKAARAVVKTAKVISTAMEMLGGGEAAAAGGGAAITAGAGEAAAGGAAITAGGGEAAAGGAAITAGGGEAAAGGAAAAGKTTTAAAAAGKIVVAAIGVSAAVGGVVGGVAGYRAAEGAETEWEAMKKSAEAVTKGAMLVIDTATDVLNKSLQSKSKLS